MPVCRQCGAPLHLLKSADGSDRCPNCGADQWVSTPLQPRQSRPHFAVTALLIAINVVVFVIMVIKGVPIMEPTSDQLRSWGADFGPLTLQGQYWRVITSSFLHIGIIHLLLNMWCLWQLGLMAEIFFGGMVTAGVYVLTGTGAALLSLAWNPLRVSAGASGAIFGIAGTLITFLYFGKLGIPREKLKGTLNSVMLFAFYNLVYGLRSGVDNMAHLGGLITGLVLGILFAVSLRQPGEGRLQFQRAVLIGMACVLAGAFVPLKHAKAAEIEMGNGLQASEGSNYAEAIQHFQKYTSMKPQDPVGHAELGYAFHRAGRTDEAGREYERSLALKPDDPWVETNLALIYKAQNRPAEAVSLFRKALPEMKDRAEIYKYYGEALKETRDYASAEDALRRSLALNGKDAEAHRDLAAVLSAQKKLEAARTEEMIAAQLEQQKSGNNPPK